MTVEVESVLLTSEGNLRLSAELAQKYFPAGVLVATLASDEELVLLPLRSAANGGLVLKQRNTAGDRAVLLSEVLRFHPPAGRFPVSWHADRGALVVALGAPLAEGASSEQYVAHGGRGGLPAVGGVPAGDEHGGRGAPAVVGAPHRERGPADGLAGSACRTSPGAATAARAGGGFSGGADRLREAT